MLKEILTNKRLMLTIVVGTLLRILFCVVGAKFYFGRDNIFVDGDTQVWVACIQNLIETGTYTMNPEHEYGYFGRTPGYSFFIGIFYLLTGKDWNAAYPLIAYTQVVLDIIAIYFVYKIGLKLFNGDEKSAVIPALLYATYPFIIVWNPVVYSELLSVFFLILGVYYFIYEEKKYNFFVAGVFISLSVLCRPQMLLMVAVMGIIIILKYRNNFSIQLKKTAQFGIAILIVYGSWPIRNYVNYGKVELTHSLQGWDTWQPDVLSFMLYIYSVKAEWEPQFSQIIKNEKVIFPKEAYITKEDSILLEKAVALSKTCGGGFSNWRGYWKDPVNDHNCNTEIETIFLQLRANQISHNPLNFYLILPLKNLAKTLFKFKLNDTSTLARKFASILFILRSILIFLGIYGIYILLKKTESIRYTGLLILLFFISLYVALCAGTGPQFRNIEMRYFLQADILLLLPASYSTQKIFSLFTKK